MSMNEFMGLPLSEEAIAAAQAEHDAAVMRSQELSARIRRLLAVELSYEQLEAFHALMSHIANSGQSAVIANWYEGIAHGAMAVRDITLGEKDDLRELG